MNKSLQCISAAAAYYMPFVDVYRNGSDIEVKGLMITFLQEIAKKLNVCYNVIGTIGQGYGARLANGSFGGMLGILHRNETDMILTPLKISYERFLHFDFTPTISQSTTKALYKRPTGQPDLAGFIKPFNFQSWLSVALSFLCFSLVIYLQNLVKRKIKRSNDEKSSSNWNLVLLKIFLGQGVNLSNKTNTIGFWILTSLVIVMAYKAILNSLLTIPTIWLPFNSFQEMVDQDEVKFLVVKGTFFANVVLKKSENGTMLKKIHEGATDVIKAATVLRLVDTGKFAFISTAYVLSAMIGKAFKQTGTCRLVIMKEAMLPYPDVLLMTKTFIYADYVKRAVTTWVEMGIFDYWIRFYMKDYEMCNLLQNENVSLRRLSLGDFYGIFLLFGGGLVLSIVVFVAELLSSFLTKRKRNNENIVENMSRY